MVIIADVSAQGCCVTRSDELLMQLLCLLKLM